MSNIFFGDSETFGVNTPDHAQLFWPWLFSCWRGEVVDNRAVGGSQIENQYPLIYSYAPAAGNRHLFMIGTNDRAVLGAAQPALDLFKNALMACGYWLAGNKRIPRGGAGWSFTGTWGDTPINTVGVYSTQHGAVASATFSGDVLALGYVMVNAGFGGVMSVSVDGVAKPDLSFTPPCNITTFNDPSVGYAPGLYTLSGLGAGEHTVVLTVTSPDGLRVFLDFIGDGANGLPLDLLTIPRMPAAGFPNTDAGVAAYNSTIGAAVAALNVLGLTNVSLLDAGGQIDPTVDMMANGHPFNSGHVKISKYLIGALTAPLRTGLT